MALTYRLHKLDLLSEWRYNQTVKELARRGFRKDEPGSTLGRESSQLLAKVFEALRDPLHKTPTDVAAELHVYVEELNEYVFGLVPVGVEGSRVQSSPVRPKLRLV
ncbi:hypothetical protein SAZ_42450 [Streptomyces noursei ZPM]|uniref:Uncharacterized protein n=1 Tax=Streptomyces noursei TaxID=1971 RepID=A0A401QRS7_STRNR|nr:hypothetical protein [Streptomyces noursei]AKA08292.1 hypothetical protein SAZ_00355 [Streptomyces noursei ZPM]AKA09304.1 hypothetical protein SAZ_42450 [Streptomyces noursei ZPM]EOT02224.1 hypothetical protein K530_19805 [Streptomyces noursei CCRC 11814]EXU92471.1 hypothetical protein P354_21415 [Streptomyces noursei PD-1]UWS76888.1 hypothetical protein N1H47_39985 [Streptomyces noursei]